MKYEVSAFSLRAQQESWVDQQMGGGLTSSDLSTSMENPNAALSSLAADKGICMRIARLIVSFPICLGCCYAYKLNQTLKQSEDD